MIQNNANRVIFNTAVLYGQIVINMVISLVSVPLIMHALGASDYGLYNLIAGVIGMLSFLNASMTVSTQRFLSVSLGEKNQEKSNRIYNNSLVLHLGLGLILVVLFEACTLFLFDGFLKIEPDRIGTAKIIYQFLVLTTFLTIISVPYGAVMNAKEDMLIFSVIGITDAVLKLLLALYLSHCPVDRLIVYGAGMALISFFTLMFNRLYVRFKYSEFKKNMRKYSDKETLKEQIGFMGWNTFGSIAMIGRNQGVAIVMNQFFGTVLNAAYGVANQINGVLGHFAQTFTKAINPQLMQSEGKGDRQRLIRISLISSKFSVLVLALFMWPLIIEMPYVLKLWLTTPPEYTLRLSQMILLYSLVHMYSNGLMSSIQATGKIRNYQITMGLLLLTNVPVSYVLLKLGYPPYYATAGFVVIEIISLVVRMFMAQKLVGLEVSLFIKKVIVPTLITMAISIVVCLVPHYLMPSSFIRLVIVCAVYAIAYCALVWFVSLNGDERNIFANLFRKIIKR